MRPGSLARCIPHDTHGHPVSVRNKYAVILVWGLNNGGLAVMDFPDRGDCIFGLAYWRILLRECGKGSYFLPFSLLRFLFFSSHYSALCFCV
jgi:hypothetical protein